MLRGARGLPGPGRVRALPRLARGVVRGVGGSGRRCHLEMDREDSEESARNGLIFCDLTNVKIYG